MFLTLFLCDIGWELELLYLVLIRDRNSVVWWKIAGSELTQGFYLSVFWEFLLFTYFTSLSLSPSFFLRFFLLHTFDDIFFFLKHIFNFLSNSFQNLGFSGYVISWPVLFPVSFSDATSSARSLQTAVLYSSVLGLIIFSSWFQLCGLLPTQFL